MPIEIAHESRFTGVEMFQMFDLDIGSAMVAAGRKSGNEELIAKGEKTAASLLVYRPRNRAGENMEAEKKTSIREKMGHPGIFAIKKNGDGTHDIIVQKTGVGGDKAFRAARTAALAAAYAERMDSEISPFESEIYSILED